MTTIKIRGFVEHGYTGASASGAVPGAKNEYAWNTSFDLRPWRDVQGALAEGVARLWVYCEDNDALERARKAAPSSGHVIEAEVTTPAHVRGFRRPRLDFEFELVSWKVVDDPELAAGAAARALPPKLKDAVLGTFELRPRFRLYETKRPAARRKKYRLVVEIGEGADPKECIARAREVAAWVEPRFAEIVEAAAAKMFDLFDGTWRQDDENDEDVVDVKSFAGRLSVESVHWNASADVGRLRVGIDDDHLFGDHGIDVDIVGGKVVRIEMG